MDNDNLDYTAPESPSTHKKLKTELEWVPNNNGE
jgi:hypothetical protein